MPGTVPDPPLHSSCFEEEGFLFLAEMYLGTMKGWIRHYFRFSSGSTKVLPGPPKYLLHQCPHRARPVPEIVPEILPDPPLHSAQIILAFRKKGFYVCLTEMYLGTLKGWIGHYLRHFGFYFGRFYQAHQSICLTSALIEPAYPK